MYRVIKYTYNNELVSVHREEFNFDQLDEAVENWRTGNSALHVMAYMVELTNTGMEIPLSEASRQLLYKYIRKADARHFLQDHANLTKDIEVINEVIHELANNRGLYGRSMAISYLDRLKDIFVKEKTTIEENFPRESE